MGGLQGRIVRISHPGKIGVRFTRDDKTFFELDFMRNNLRKIKKQEAPKRDDLTTCPHCGDPCAKGLGKYSPTCTAPEAHTKTSFKSFREGAICARCSRIDCVSLDANLDRSKPYTRCEYKDICRTCKRETGTCTATGGDLQCVPPAERRDEILTRREDRDDGV